MAQFWRCDKAPAEIGKEEGILWSEGCIRASYRREKPFQMTATSYANVRAPFILALFGGFHETGSSQCFSVWRLAGSAMRASCGAAAGAGGSTAAAAGTVAVVAVGRARGVAAAASNGATNTGQPLRFQKRAGPKNPAKGPPWQGFAFGEGDAACSSPCIGAVVSPAQTGVMASSIGSAQRAPAAPTRPLILRE